MKKLRWLTQLRKQLDLLTLVLLLVAVAGIWTFVEVADEVVEGSTQRFDEWALRILRQQDDPADAFGPLWLEEAGRDFTALGGVAVLALVTAAAVGYLWLNGERATVTFVLAAVGGGLILTFALKSFFDRPRPDLVPHLSHVYTTSFPSGHSMLSAVVYLTLGALLAKLVHKRRLKLYIIALALVLTLLVGLSRVYVGVHYPTDVLAGWLGGLSWATLCWLAAYMLQKRGIIKD